MDQSLSPRLNASPRAFLVPAGQGGDSSSLALRLIAYPTPRLHDMYMRTATRNATAWAYSVVPMDYMIHSSPMVLHGRGSSGAGGAGLLTNALLLKLPSRHLLLLSLPPTFTYKQSFIRALPTPCRPLPCHLHTIATHLPTLPIDSPAQPYIAPCTVPMLPTYIPPTSAPTYPVFPCYLLIVNCHSVSL